MTSLLKCLLYNRWALMKVSENELLLIIGPRNFQPVLDAEGYAECPNCRACIHCGTVGLANLEKWHCGMKICLETKAKQDKNAKVKRNRSLTFFICSLLIWWTKICSLTCFTVSPSVHSTWTSTSKVGLWGLWSIWVGTSKACSEVMSYCYIRTCAWLCS